MKFIGLESEYFLTLPEICHCHKMNTSNNSTPATGINAVGTHDMLVALSNRKWFYLFLLLFIGSFSFWLLRYSIFTYSSEASFYLSESSTGTNVGQNQEFRLPEVLQPGEQFNRTYQMVTSSALQEHLIRKFKLLEHYEIDTTNEFYFEEAIAKLSGRIQVKKSPFNTIAVTVSDKHRYLAADMTNEIISYLDQLNKKLIVNSLKQKLNVFESLLKNMEKDNTNRSVFFNKQMADLNQILSRLEKQPINSIAVMDLQSQLAQVISSLQRSTEDLMRMKVIYALTLQSIQDKNLPSIVVVQKARPSYRSLGWQSLLISAVIVLLVITGIVYSVYIKLRYKNYFQVLMSNNNPKEELKTQHKDSL